MLGASGSLESLGRSGLLPYGVQLDHAHDERGDRRPVPSQHLKQVEQHFRDFADDPHVLHRQMILLSTGSRAVCTGTYPASRAVHSSQHYELPLYGRHLNRIMLKRAHSATHFGFITVKSQLNVY